MRTVTARALAPLASQKPRTVGRELWAVGLAVSLFLIVRAGQIGFARWNRALIDSAQSGSEAMELARGAATADPFDPEPRLALGQLQRNKPEGEAEFQAAARISPGGMTFYLLGRYYREHAMDETDRLRSATIVKSALEAYERARAYDPHNLQVLRALAETQFTAAVDQNDAELLRQARFTYETMAALEHAPYGKIRAVPEVVETDFAFAHDGLARIAAREQKLDVAEKELGEALRILRYYWERRNWLINLNRSVEKRKVIGDLYQDVLMRTVETLRQEKRAAETEVVAKELHTVEADIQADEAKNIAPAG